MLSEAAREKLRDPAYFALHTQAFAAIRDVGAFKWYDSNFLRRYEAAKKYLAMVRPEALAAFVAGFEPIRPPRDFAVRLIDDLFDPATRAIILDISRSVEPTGTEQAANECRKFGRQVVWDHPFFRDLQRELVPLVSELAGRELVPGYNFLSLYGGTGKCDPHMDEPISMYTLDYCIDQSEEWPIHFSRLVDWPSLEDVREWDKQALTSDPELEFAPHVLKPNQALLFNGSSQWHYRDAIAPGGFCNLLFFHYFPAGCEAIVVPAKWAEAFDIPELGPLCDLFTKGDAEGLE
jgi:hypothetical protein